VDHRKCFSQIHEWICTSLKDKKKLSKTKQNISPNKLFWLDLCKLVYSEFKDEIGCTEFFFCFNRLFSCVQKNL